jgi:hypothetical protein
MGKASSGSDGHVFTVLAFTVLAFTGLAFTVLAFTGLAFTGQAWKLPSCRPVATLADAGERAVYGVVLPA